MTVEQAKQKVLDLTRDKIGHHEKASNSQLNDKMANTGSGGGARTIQTAVMATLESL